MVIRQGRPRIPAGLGDVDLQLRTAERLAHGAGVERDFLDDHVVRLGRWTDRQAVAAVAEGAGRHGHRVHQRRLHEVQLADAAVVEADVPFELHVTLPDQQGCFDRVCSALELQLQGPTLRPGPGKLLPFRPARRPQVVAVRVDDKLGAALLGAGDEQGEQERGEPPGNLTAHLRLLRPIDQGDGFREYRPSFRQPVSAVKRPGQKLIPELTARIMLLDQVFEFGQLLVTRLQLRGLQGE